MTVQSIVVGVDGSPESASAASVAWMLARAADAPCRLVHATDAVGTSLAGARADVRVSLEDCVPSSVVDAMVVSRGATADVLEAVIREMVATMLVLGGKHHSKLGRWLGGSTVQQVVRQLTVPLLVTAGELRVRPRVLVAVDQSYAAGPTIHQAVAFARLLGSPLHALHVVDPPPAIAELPRNWSRDIVVRDIWPRIPLVEQGKVIREGVPFETIVDEAAAWHADVIVVGSHGKGWVDRLLIGSVTEDLLNNLPCAVLVVPVPAPTRHEPAALEAATADV
jgi:nucleotide-binding universal stress UspA family protein